MRDSAHRGAGEGLGGMHRAYDDATSSLSIRLERVRWHLARALDEAQPGPVRLVSLCAGQGLDVLGVLPGHSRRRDVSALLVEADPLNAEVAKVGAATAGIDTVRGRHAHAGIVTNFPDAPPADVVLLCRLFRN